jgi:hypothetical protein
MLKWLQQRRRRRANGRFVKAVPAILARYGELIEAHPTAYIDETQLPVDKEMMKAALKIGWKLADNDKQREWLKVGWILLSQFQKGVGETPIDCNLSPGLLPSDEEVSRLDRFLQFAKIAEAETEKNRAEMFEFIRQNSG